MSGQLSNAPNHDAPGAGSPPADLADLFTALAGPGCGIAYHDLVTGERWCWGDAERPAASLIKVHLAIAAYQAVERGELALGEAVEVAPLPEDDEAGFDDLGRATAGLRFPWRKVLDRMITESDNAATNTLIRRLGLNALDGLATRLGLGHTRLRRLMLDQAAKRAGLENVTTTAEMATVLAALYRGELLSPAFTRELLGLLGQQRWNEKLAAGLPANTPFLHKTGEVSGFRHDAGIVAGDAPWVLAVMAEGGAETDTAHVRIATLLFEHHERRHRAFAGARRWLDEGRQRWLADPRDGHDTLTLTWESGQLFLDGETTLAERLAAPLPEGLKVRATQLVGQPAIVSVGCFQLRRGPGHAHELVSQLRLGDRVTVLVPGPEWQLLAGPDGYLAYGKTNNLQTGTFVPTHRVAEPLVTAKTEAGRVVQLSAGSLVGVSGDAFELPGGERVPLAPEVVVPLGHRGDVAGALALAKRFLGLPYLWGGTTGWGLDCSGLVQLVHAVMGVALPRDADQQQEALEAVATVEALQPGDLVFFPGHVGISLGGGDYIHASAKWAMVTLNSFDPASPIFDADLLGSFTGGGRSPLRLPVAPQPAAQA